MTPDNTPPRPDPDSHEPDEIPADSAPDSAPDESRPSPDEPGGTDQESLFEVLRSWRRPGRDKAGSRRFRARETVFTLHCQHDRQMRFDCRGALNVQGDPVAGWAVDFGALNAQVNDLGRLIAAFHDQQDEGGRARWQQAARSLGQQMWAGLLNVDERLTRTLLRAGRTVRSAEQLTLVFAGPPSYLSVPFELLNDSQHDLALRHPLARRITGPQASNRTAPPFSRVLTDLHDAHEPLRVLLVASTAGADDPTESVDWLEEIMRRRANAMRLPVVVTVLAGRAATPDAVAEALAEDTQIIHVAAPLYTDSLDPERGALLLSPHSQRWGAVPLPLDDLAALAGEAHAQIIYLDGPPHIPSRTSGALREAHYLNGVETLAAAGLPYTIGLRWHTPLARRADLAAAFYDALLGTAPAPEHALLRARQAVARTTTSSRPGTASDAPNRPPDESWTAPILAMQAAPDSPG